MTRQNQLIIAAVAVLIIILGLFGYLFMGKNQAKSANTTSNAPKAANTGSSTQSSITDLFTSGATKQCTFDAKGSTGGETKGTVYVSGNNAYGSFDMTTNGKVTTTNLIRNDTTFYIWGGSLPSGIKMTMDVNQMATKMQGNQYSTFNPSEKVNYNCTNWSVDQSKFTPPSTVKFIDASAMMPKTTTTPSTKAGTQDPCAGITDATTKAACQNAMHKNGY